VLGKIIFSTLPCARLLAGVTATCDDYVYPEYNNFSEKHISRMIFSEGQKEFGFAKCNDLPQPCRDCKYLFACNGECPKNRLIRTREGEPGLNYLCSGLQHFWQHIDRDMKDTLRRAKCAGTPHDLPTFRV
jgi:uncharacterized protein